MKSLADSDFTVTRNDDSGVSVVFTPTDSHYDFRLLADAEDILRFGPRSGDVLVRHGGKTGDTREYSEREVMATDLALATVSD